MKAFDIMREHYQYRDRAALSWKEKGVKVVGYFSDSVPEEMILAAGFFPLRLSGDPWGGTEAADRYTEPFYEPNVRSMFNMLLTGRYDFLDFLIIPHSRSSILGLYYYLHRVKEIDPALKLPTLYLFDLPQTRFYMSSLYFRDRVHELKKTLEDWSGKAISTDALSQAIATCNENRKLLKEVASSRVADPPRISGVEALQIIGSSMFMLKEKHNKLLRQFLREVDDLPARDGARLFVEGSPLDNLQFYELVESLQATIVAEDNCWGNRYFEHLVDTSIEPLEAIADRYHLKSPCPRIQSIEQRVEYCLQKATQAKAQGAIFYILKWDHAPRWEYPHQRMALEEMGIPTICFDMQEYLISETESMKTGIADFIDSIKQKTIRR